MKTLTDQRNNLAIKNTTDSYDIIYFPRQCCTVPIQFDVFHCLNSVLHIHSFLYTHMYTESDWDLQTQVQQEHRVLLIASLKSQGFNIMVFNMRNTQCGTLKVNKNKNIEHSSL